MHNASGQRKLQDVVEEWNYIWQSSPPVLKVYDEGPRLRIVDTRPLSRQQAWTVGELEAKIYHFCDSARTPAVVIKELSGSQDMNAEDIRSAIQRLCES